jgi:endonuclease-8
MPEGPEIAREADRLREALEGEALERIYFAFPHLTRRSRALVGARVLGVRSRGKAMLISLEGGLTIYSHNQLYGRWLVRGAGERPRTNRSLRLALETASRAALLYSASQIELLDEPGLALHPYLAKLGPDALDPQTDAITLARRLADPRFRRRSLAALLLDQSFVAGLGNYLRSEIAFEARVDPRLRPMDLSRAERARVARAILRLTRRAYARRGVTLPRRRHDAARRDGETWAQARHWVFARSGRPCRRCEATVKRVVMAGRRLYLCPICQADRRDREAPPTIRRPPRG